MPLNSRVMSAYAFFERAIVYVLLGLLVVVVLFATWALASELLSWLWIRLSGGDRIDAHAANEFFERLNLLRKIFGGFMLVLIGIELMKTIVMYLDERVLHVEVVFTVAVIAIARHAIDLDIGETQPLTLVGMGAMILALTVGYFYYCKAIGHGVGVNGAGAKPPADRPGLH